MKNSYIVPLLAVALLLTGWVAPAAAAEAGSVKIAVISIQEVLERSSAGREARRRLEAEVDKHRSGLQREQAALEALRDEIDKKSSVWSDQVRTDKEREFQRRLREFEASNEDAQLAVQQQERTLMEPILQELDKIIEEFGRKNGYALILEYTMKGLRSRTGLLYAADSLEISEQVRQELDKRLKR